MQVVPIVDVGWEAERFDIYEHEYGMSKPFRSEICACSSGAKSTFHIHVGSNGIHIKHDDYLIRQPDGKFLVLSPLEFRAKFAIKGVD